MYYCKIDWSGNEEYYDRMSNEVPYYTNSNNILSLYMIRVLHYVCPVWTTVVCPTLLFLWSVLFLLFSFSLGKARTTFTHSLEK